MSNETPATPDRKILFEDVVKMLEDVSADMTCPVCRVEKGWSVIAGNDESGFVRYASLVELPNNFINASFRYYRFAMVVCANCGYTRLHDISVLLRRYTQDQGKEK